MTIARATRTKLLTGALGAAAAIVVAAARAHAAPDGPDVPTTIEVEDGHKVFLVGHATGVQIYRCDGVGPATHGHWSLHERPSPMTRAGPSVRTSVVPPGRRRTAAPSSAAGSTASRSTPPPSRGCSSRRCPPAPVPTVTGSPTTSFIQRTATTGGLAPAASSCNVNTTGAIVEVPYTADYHFWKPTGS